MKKGVVFGCLGAVVVVCVGAAAAGYYFVYRPAKTYITSLAKWHEVPQLNAQVKNRATFTPPAAGELSTAQVNKVLTVQQSIRTALGPLAQDLDAKYKAMDAKRGNRDPSLPEILTALKDLSTLYLQAKRAQVDALNAQGLSLEEYEWSRASIYAASGIPVDFRFERIIRDIGNGKEPSLDSIVNPLIANVPDKNKQLVAPFQKQFADAVGLAFFGL